MGTSPAAGVKDLGRTQCYSWNSATLWCLLGELLRDPSKGNRVIPPSRGMGAGVVTSGSSHPSPYMLTLNCCASVPVAQFYHLFLPSASIC